MPLFWPDRRSSLPNAGATRATLVDGSLRFVTREGLWWTVREEFAADQSAVRAEPGAAGRGALLFESDLMRRRVHRYPANWASLTNEALEELVLTG
jgi:hypothetical protein